MADKTEPPGIPKTVAFLMLIIIVCLAVLAVFANVQRFRRDDVEAVGVRLVASPTPQAHER